MQAELDSRKIIRYIILYSVICCIGIGMCYIDYFIPYIDLKFKSVLMRFFVFLSAMVPVVGAIRTFPKDRFSNLRVWFYYAIMGGLLSVIYSFIKLIDVLDLLSENKW